jgi:hypothetical protein
MPATLPSLTETIDNAFLHTWYQIRPQAMDQILNGTPLEAILREKGCFTPQKGGRYITRTVFYDYPTTNDVQKGDDLGQGEIETDTMALWTWRYIAVAVQRSLFDDQVNSGPDKIRDYVATKLERARQSFTQKQESSDFNAQVTDESGKLQQSIFDIVPTSTTNASTGTYGKIARPTGFSGNTPNAGNTWWSPRYASITGPIDVTLVTDMTSAYNLADNNQQDPPDVILTDRPTFELYEEFGRDVAQIMMNSGTKKLLDLGFNSLQFKGASMIYSSNMTTSHVKFLNSSHIEVVYDPGMQAAMTPWKDMGGGTLAERVAHILSARTMITDQPRRHCELS